MFVFIDTIHDSVSLKKFNYLLKNLYNSTPIIFFNIAYQIRRL